MSNNVTFLVFFGMLMTSVIILTWLRYHYFGHQIDDDREEEKNE